MNSDTKALLRLYVAGSLSVLCFCIASLTLVFVNFFRLELAAIRVFVPAVLAVAVVWGCWMVAAHHFILKPYLEHAVELERRQALGQLAARVAHDIRSPLAALRTLLDAGGPGTDETEDLLRRTIARIAEIADDLMATQRAEQGPATGSCGMAEVASSIVRERTVTLEPERSIRLEVADDVRQARLPLEPGAFGRLVSNLLNNAVEALGEGGGRVTVALEGRGPGRVSLVVRDEGAGMTPEILQRVRAAGGTFGKRGGSGLGLQFVKETVARAGGLLHIESTPGRGTTVTVEFPAG